MKYALHGFWGNADLLKKMTVRRRRKYWVRHMVKVREAIRQEIKPNDFKALKRTLDIDWESFDFGGKDPNIMLYEAQSASSIGAPSP